MEKNFSTVYIYTDYSKNVCFSLNDGEIKAFEDGNVFIKIENTIDNFCNLVDFRVDFKSSFDHLDFWISYEKISSIEFYHDIPKRRYDDVDD
jgi:hypothetical protein